MVKRLVLMTAMAATLVGGLGGVAYASTPTPVSGNFSATITPGTPRFADGNEFLPVTFNETFYGSLSGTRVGSGILIVHPDGTVNVFASGTFTGTIVGNAGTAIISEAASGIFASLMTRVHMSDGAGGLAGIHGQLSGTAAATGPTTFAGTYSGQVGFPG
jgi:hypothetical protein